MSRTCFSKNLTAEGKTIIQIKGKYLEVVFKSNKSIVTEHWPPITCQRFDTHYFTKLTLTISLPDGTARAILQMMELGFTERPKDRPQHRTSKWQSWDWLLTCLPFVRILTLIYMTIICFPFLNSFSPTPSSFSSVCSLHSLLPFPFLPSVPQAISKATTATARHLLESRSGDMRP